MVKWTEAWAIFEEGVCLLAQSKLENRIRSYVLDFGPQYPAAHAVLRLILEVDGEGWCPREQTMCRLVKKGPRGLCVHMIYDAADLTCWLLVVFGHWFKPLLRTLVICIPDTYFVHLRVDYTNTWYLVWVFRRNQRFHRWCVFVVVVVGIDNTPEDRSQIYIPGMYVCMCACVYVCMYVCCMYVPWRCWHAYPSSLVRASMVVLLFYGGRA